jgi:hypothetical protein
MDRGMGTSLSYTNHLSEPIEAKAAAGRHVVAGMPYRRAYAADQGWDELMSAYVRKAAAPPPRARQGAVGTPPAVRPAGAASDESLVT